MTVRKGTADDLYDLLPLVKKFWKEGNYTNLTYDAKYIAGMYERHLSNPACEVFLYDTEGEITGMLMAAVMPQAFSERPAAYEIAWYVSKEARGTSAAFRLVKAYEDWAKNRNCDFMNMSRVEGVEDEKLHSMYDKLGFNVREHTYVKELT